MAKANYTIVARGEGFLTIRDVGPWDRFQSVTNAADETVAELMAACAIPAGGRLFYFDSEGEPGELVIQGGTFHHFAPASEMDMLGNAGPSHG